MISGSFNIVVPEDAAGIRIDKFLQAKLTDISRSCIQKLIEEGNVRRGAKSVEKNYKIRAFDEIEIIIPEPVNCEASPEDIPLDIAFEDKHLLVVNKQKGMVVHPAAGNCEGTLVNALLSYCGDELSGINGVLRPGIVHRIDKDTSGLLIVAKNDISHRGLAKQIKDHSFKRIYEAVVCGGLKNDRGTINLPIGRHKTNRKKMAVTTQNAKEAVTHYEVIKCYKSYTHLKLVLETGRTHQIRVHMAHIGNPVAGDSVYGNKRDDGILSGQCLHAKFIEFTHPVTGKVISIDSVLPEYFVNFLERLGEGR